jgi:hypothetical protein
MKHMTREEAFRSRVLQRARTVAIIGASSNPARHSYSVVTYEANGSFASELPVVRDSRGLLTFDDLIDVVAESSRI